MDNFEPVTQAVEAIVVGVLVDAFVPVISAFSPYGPLLAVMLVSSVMIGGIFDAYTQYREGGNKLRGTALFIFGSFLAIASWQDVANAMVAIVIFSVALILISIVQSFMD